MTKEELDAITVLAREFIKKVNDLNVLAFSTVVVTQGINAIVIGNDNPVNALAAISQGFNFGDASPVEMSQFIFDDTTRH